MHVDIASILAEHPGMDCDTMETAAAGQQSVTQWGEMFIETGGDVKALKSHWGLHYLLQDTRRVGASGVR